MVETLLRVAHHQRHSREGTPSLDRVFATVRANLPQELRVTPSICAPGRSLIARMRSAFVAARVRADVHHVLGDVHYLALALPGPRTVLTVHDCVSLHRLTGIRRAAFKLLWYTLPLARSGAVTTGSEFVRQELLRLTNCSPKKLSVIYDPLPERFAPAPQRHRSGAARVLCVGTSRNKNLERIAAALAGTPVEVHLLGEPTCTQREAFGRYSVKLVAYGRVSDDEVPKLYARTDLLLFPSTYEGFGLPIIEAQATGRPVVTSGTCSMPEIAGAGAMCVDPLSTDSIRSGVLRVLSDAALQARLVALGYENVKRFDPVGIARAYAAIYLRLAARAGCVRVAGAAPPDAHVSRTDG